MQGTIDCGARLREYGKEAIAHRLDDRTGAVAGDVALDHCLSLPAELVVSDLTQFFKKARRVAEVAEHQGQNGGVLLLAVAFGLRDLLR